MLNYSLLTYKERVQCFLENQEVDLEKAADYLLNSPDLESPKKLQYKVFDDRQMFLKSIKEADAGLDELRFTDVMRNQVNWKKQKKQVLKKEDLEKPIIKDYQEFIEHCQKAEGNSWVLAKQIGESRAIQKMVKDRHVIYFKHIGDESTENNLDWIDLDNPKHVRELLRIRSNNLSTWLGCITLVIDELTVNLTERRKEVLKLWRQGLTMDQIANYLGLSIPSVYNRLDVICKDIIKEYCNGFNEYIYSNYIKAEYKKCRKCGETKFVWLFSHDKREKDGLNALCTKCKNNYN